MDFDLEGALAHMRGLLGFQRSASAPAESGSGQRDDDENEERKKKRAEPVEDEAEEVHYVAAGQEFKFVPDTRFVVDGFRLRDVPIEYEFFLTHFHSDHYTGISKGWNRPLWCSEITGRLVVASLGVAPHLIRVLPLNLALEIDGVRVTCFDANHCPGALLILFETEKSKTLHVGDFRWNRCILERSPRLAALEPRELTHLFLDTTFNDPKFDFCPQERVFECAIELTRQVLEKYVNPLILFGSYSIGKEKLFFAVAKALNLRIYASERKVSMLRLCCTVEDMSLFVTDREKANIQVVGLGKCSFTALTALSSQLAGQHDAFVGFAPTGWCWPRITRKKRAEQPYTLRAYNTVHAYGLPYSEHSSYNELVECVAHFRPQSIVPTVHTREGSTPEAVAAQLKPFLKYIDLTRDKSTIVSHFVRSASDPVKRAAPVQPPPPPPPPSSSQGSLTQRTLAFFFAKK